MLPASPLTVTRPVARSRAAPVHHVPNLLLCFLSFCPALLHRLRDTLPSRRRHGAACVSWRSAPTFTPTGDTLQSLDRSIKLAALLFELLDNLVNAHGEMLTLGTPSSVRSNLLHATTLFLLHGLVLALLGASVAED